MTALPAEGIILVKALQARRFRAGLEFGRELRELAAADLGEGLEGLSKLVMLAEDPLLAVTVVFGDEARPIGPDELGELRAVIEAEKLRVDPANPPEPITQLQPLGGSNSEPDSAAAPAGDEGEKASDVKDAAAADPNEDIDASAASMGHDREQAGDAAADQKAASNEDHQPGATVPAPVAELNNPESESQPAGEQTGSPAADAKPRTNTRREKAKA